MATVFTHKNARRITALDRRYDRLCGEVSTTKVDPKKLQEALRARGLVKGDDAKS